MLEGNLGVISDLKQALLQDILTDEKAVKLIANTPNITLPALDLRYKQVVPWKKVPNTVEEATSYVTFEVRIPQVITKATRIYRLDIYVMTNENTMKIDNAEGTRLGIPDRGSRIDILADRIDYLVNDSKRYTFDEMKFISSDTFTPYEKFFGRVISYEIRGWNMGGDKLG